MGSGQIPATLATGSEEKGLIPGKGPTKDLGLTSLVSVLALSTRSILELKKVYEGRKSGNSSRTGLADFTGKEGWTGSFVSTSAVDWKTSSPKTVSTNKPKCCKKSIPMIGIIVSAILNSQVNSRPRLRVTVRCSWP